MKILFCFFFLVSIFCSQQIYSQDRITLSGKIINDATSRPIYGATILIENVRNGTTSDSDGNYQLSGIKKGDKIRVSVENFRSKYHTINGNRIKQNWDFRLVDDLLSLSEIVVTNFGGLKEEEKIQSSVAVTTISNKEIDQRLPRSNADLLKSIPGLWVESAGGEGPAGVWVRGFPQSGGYSFLGLMEDGLPIFQTGYFGLPSPDQFYKVDETLNKVEAIRGGSAPIVMQGASGAVVNHISKTGSEIFKGIAKVSYGPDQGLGRIDFNIGGPISDKTTYNIGGFYRDENGLYDYGYSTNKGGQIRANILQTFNKFKIKYSVKYINDRVNWNLPSPYIFNKDGSILEVPGFNLKTAGMGTDVSDTEFSFRSSSGDLIERDLKDGFFSELFSAGLEMNFTLSDNWSLTNKFRYDDIVTNNNTDLLTQINSLDPDGSYVYSDGTPITNPGTLNNNGLFASNVLVANDNDYSQIINRMELSTKSNKNSLTIGGEFYSYKLTDYIASSLTNKEVKNSPRRIIDLNLPLNQIYKNGIIPSVLVNGQGESRTEGTENTLSFYVNDKWDISNKFRLDLGVRFDNKSVIGNNYDRIGQSILEGGQGFVLTNNKTPYEDSRSSIAASLGLNYKISNNSAFFLRSSLSGSSLKIGDYNAEPDAIEVFKNTKSNDVIQAELGYKYRGEKAGLFASLVYATVEDASSPIFLPTNANGVIVQNIFQSTRTISAEIEAQYKPTSKLSFRLITTLQNAEYTKLTFIARPESTVAGDKIDWTGNLADRVPNISSDFTTSYIFGDLMVSAGFRYYGSRWSTPANNIKLKSYTELTAGLRFDINTKLTLSVQGSNLLNTIAIIEGNVQGDQFTDPNALNGNITTGKRILPRIILFKLAYKFGK